MRVETITAVSNNFSIQKQADNDNQVIAMWLHARSAHTQRAYGKDLELFLDFAGVGIAQVTLQMLQAYADSVADLADTTVEIQMIKNGYSLSPMGEGTHPLQMVSTIC